MESKIDNELDEEIGLKITIGITSKGISVSRDNAVAKCIPIASTATILSISKSACFLTIEDNKTKILESGTEVDFLEIANYIENQKNDSNQYEKLYRYFDKQSDEVLLVGIKMNRMEQ